MCLWSDPVQFIMSCYVILSSTTYSCRESKVTSPAAPPGWPGNKHYLKLCYQSVLRILSEQGQWLDSVTSSFQRDLAGNLCHVCSAPWALRSHFKAFPKMANIINVSLLLNGCSLSYWLRPARHTLPTMSLKSSRLLKDIPSRPPSVQENDGRGHGVMDEQFVGSLKSLRFFSLIQVLQPCWCQLTFDLPPLLPKSVSSTVPNARGS